MTTLRKENELDRTLTVELEDCVTKDQYDQMHEGEEIERVMLHQNHYMRLG